MQDESADQVFEELQAIVQEGILRGFPNPERHDCPGSEVLRELANRPRPTRDAGWDHVTHCSPCYREFLDLRARVKQERELERRRKLRRRALIAATPIVLVGCVLAGYEFLHNVGAGSSASGRYETASLDLKDLSAARGEGVAAAEKKPRVLHATRLDLTILLPLGSEPGQYEVQVLKNADEPLVTAAGEARVEHGATVLRTKLDLSQQKPGMFFLGVRQPPSDWTYCPVRIE